MNLAIFEPDIPQNTGAMVRICSCFGVNIDIIHPASFAMSEKSLSRVAMDYGKNINLTQFDDWKHYEKNRKERKILLSTKGKLSHYDFEFKDTDNLIVGRESAGVPDYVHNQSDQIIKIPITKAQQSCVPATALEQKILRGLSIRIKQTPRKK